MQPKLFSITRRELLSAATAGALGLACPASGADVAVPVLGSAPLNCICLFNSGGMSQIELWDPKPHAPAEIRGEFSPIETTVPGIYVSELLPQTARWAHKLAIVRSMTHAETDHARARRLIAEATNDKTSIANCELQIDAAAFRESPLQSDGPADLERNCRTACQSIAGGCRFVAIENGHWDTHSRSAWTLKEILAPAFDRAFSGLIADLDAQGLLDSTTVVVATEFGRSPRINDRGGRDHWPAAFSVVLAGGGIAGGQVIGRTDRHGARVVDDGVAI